MVHLYCNGLKQGDVGDSGKLGDNYEVNNWSEETEALTVIVLEYGTVKSAVIRLRGVQFPKMTQNTRVSLIS